MYSQNVRDENGESFIPASQRPDGTWRKARRVKDGYVPQEEVPLYESKGRQLLNKRLEPANVASVPDGFVAHKSIPGLFIPVESEKTKPKKKNKKVEEISKRLDQVKIEEPKSKVEACKPKVKQENKNNKSEEDSSQSTDPAKKLKNLKKRLREVEALEEKVKSGEISKPDPDQLTKLKRKPELLVQIRDLERQV